MDDSAFTPGAQALRRGLKLLRLLGQHQREGLRVSDAVELVGLERSTAHRLLACLAEEQFAEKDEVTRRYRLGFDAMQLGSAAVRKMPVVQTFRPLMLKLARMSGDTVFLVVRDGDEVLCLHREEGPYPVKVFTIDVGGRRLLGIGAGGLALMAALPDEEIADIIVRNKAAYAAAGLDPSTLWRSIRETRAAGSATIIETITPGVAGMGVVVPASLRVQAAISFGSITPRFTPERRRELAALLATAFDGLKGKRSSR